MTVVPFSSLEGGVGKLTCAILCATNLAARGHKVLVLDLDRNNSATMFFTAGIENIENEIASKNMFEAFRTTPSTITSFHRELKTSPSCRQVYIYQKYEH